MHDARFQTAFDDAGFDVEMVVTTPGSNEADSAQRIRSAVAQFSPSVTLAGTVPFGARLAALVNAPRLIAMSWGTDMLVEAFADDEMRRAGEHALRNADGLFADTPSVLVAAEALSPGITGRSFVMPWGVNLEQFTPGRSSLGLRASLGWGDCDLFISTRSWEPIYAIDVLIRAFAATVRRKPSARLLLAGGGSQEAVVRELIATLGVEPYIEVIGRFDGPEIVEYLRLADVYVSSATSDGASISLLEAMACGLPAIAVGRFGNLDWIKPGENGWLVEPRDPQSLADAMSLAVEQRAERRAMATANIEVVRSRADWSRNLPGLLDFIRRVASGEVHR